MNRGCLLIILLLLLLSACTKNNQIESIDVDKSRDELILAIGGEQDDGYDPTTGWGRHGSPLFQSTLFKYDKDFQIINDLATGYAVSEDGLEYTIELRKDVKFSDGEKLTADDVVFTYETAKTSGSIIDLSNMEKVEKVNEYTVRFRLKKPESTFNTLLISTGIVPQHAYTDSYNENPIGSGPYKLVQWDKEQQLIVEENPYYYGKSPYFKKLTFLFLSEDAAYAAAKTGEVDIVSVPPSFATKEIKGMRLIELESVDNRGIVFPYIKYGEETIDGVPVGNNVTEDIAIRKAMNLAIDRDALVAGVLDGYGTPAYSVADYLPWWNPDTVIHMDKEKAKEILDEAGWKETEEGIREKAGIRATFTLLYPAGDAIRQSLSIAFADEMKELGIEVIPEGKSWNELERLMHNSPVMMGWGSHDPLEMYNIYSSSTKGVGYYNINFYTNPFVDQYMEQAMRATTQEEANKYWQKAQWDGNTGFSALGDAPWVWLVNLKHLYFVHEELNIGEQKLQPHGHGWPITDFIENWHWD